MKAKSEIATFLKKNQDRAALLGLLLGLVIFIGVGLSLQKSGKKNVIESGPDPDPEKVELKMNSSGEGEGGKSPPPGSTVFFLKPSPEELLEQLKSMENLNENVVNAKFSGLKMLWPVYFFSLEEASEQGTDKRKLLADVEKDGFGVLVKADILLTDFPQLGGLEQGQKIWIGGELLAIDPEGTGVMYLTAEHLSVGEEQPIAVKNQSEEAVK